MKKKLMLMQLNMKRAFSYVPTVLLSTFLMLFAFGMLLLMLVYHEMKKQQDFSKIPVAVVVEDDNPYTGMAVAYIRGEKMVNELCDLVEMNREDAVQSLNNQSVAVVVLIPAGFMNGVLSGANIPARIILDHAGVGTKSGQLRSLLAAAAMDLGITQAAIYAVDALCVEHGIDAVEASEDYLNQKFFKFFMRRSRVFSSVEVSATGDLSLTQFYGAVLLVLILFLNVIVCGNLFAPEKNVLNRILSLKEGISEEFVLLTRFGAALGCYFVLFMGGYLVMVLAGMVPFHFLSPVKLFLAIGGVFAIGFFIFHLTDHPVTAALTIFVYVMVDLFVSGNIIPSFFLPPLVNRLGMVSPTRYIVRCMGSVLAGHGDGADAGITLLISLVFLMATMVLNRMKNQWEMVS